ncbi:MAG: phosphoribosylanthranilate isomerase [Methanoregulaceae archaeon]|nr:phosphoribosylanthranilate isomerase [Methanoregulaceae archaeon]
MRVKICGITSVEDAVQAEAAGADAIGVVMFSGGVSKRVVSMERAREIFEAVGPFTATVAVSHTHSMDDVARMLELHPSAIQISHPFSFPKDLESRLIRVIGRGEPLPEDCDAVIIDDSHGMGLHYDPSYARDVVRRSKVPVILAGGLTPGNVKDAIADVRPYAVDVASGVENRPGIKEPGLVSRFIRNVKEAPDDR